jgi:hypothetical protein
MSCLVLQLDHNKNLNINVYNAGSVIDFKNAISYIYVTSKTNADLFIKDFIFEKNANTHNLYDVWYQLSFIYGNKF